MPNTYVPRDHAPRTIIAPWWDDLDMEAQGEVYVNSSIPGQLVITWSAIRGWGSDAPRGGPYSFQLVLTTTGRFLFNYLDMGEERLDESTIGFQDEDGEMGQTIVHNAGYVHSDMTIEVLVPRIWLYTLENSGIVAPGGDTQFVRFMVTAAHVQEGEYSGSLELHTNDSENVTVTIPVDLTVVAGGNPPVVSDIPDQTVDEGTPFVSIDLDDYVTDEIWADDRISWEISGATELIIGLAGRTVTINVPDPEWSGSETLTFTATNPEDLSDSDEATFTVNAVNEPPTSFGLMTPANHQHISDPNIFFRWHSAVDPEGGDVTYSFTIDNGLDDPVTISELSDTTYDADLDLLGFPVWGAAQYTWFVRASDPDGNTTTSEEWEINYSRTDLGEEIEMPTVFSIGALYPNPFNPSTSVTIGLPQAAPIKLQVYDLLGRQVAKLDYGTRSAGYHHLSWGGATHSSGIYFMVIDAGPMHEVRKAVLMK